MSNAGKTGLPLNGDSLTEVDGFGADDPEPEKLARGKELAAQIARQIRAECGEGIDRRGLSQILAAFRTTLFPRRRPGRKGKAEISAAHADYRNGLRGLELYRKHIPNLDRMSRWRRECEIRRLREAIRTRERLGRFRYVANTAELEDGAESVLVRFHLCIPDHPGRSK